MASEEHLQLLRQGVSVWNDWREKNPEIIPDLYHAQLSHAQLSKAQLSKAYLSKANLNGANLSKVHLNGADLFGQYLTGADLSQADLSQADLSQANLSQTHLNEANLSGANLSQSNLSGTLLIQTDLCGASLAESNVYGASVWDIKVNDQTKQQNLVITAYGKPAITVDNIKVAQFIYLLLNNKEIRDVIDTISSKAVFRIPAPQPRPLAPEEDDELPF